LLARRWCDIAELNDGGRKAFALKAKAFLVSAFIIQIIQQIEKSLDEYAFAGKNVLDFVLRPDVCPRCGELHAFHNHGRYSRFVDELEIWIARFRCTFCGLDVSILPSFAMPYRNRSVKVVDRYFRATVEERRNMSGHDTLRRYWQAWLSHWRVIARTIGLDGHFARTIWQDLAGWFGTISQAQSELVGRYRYALLRRYVIHTLPN
jgi:transposase-like protein